MSSYEHSNENAPMSPRGGGGYSDIFFTYVGSCHFWGVQNFEFQYFWGFQKNEYFGGGGYEDCVDIFFGVITKLDYISMHFSVFS